LTQYFAEIGLNQPQLSGNKQRVAGIAGIAVIARDRRNRKSKTRQWRKTDPQPQVWRRWRL